MKTQEQDHIVFSAKEEASLAHLPTINDNNYYDDRSYISNSMLSMLNESPAKLQSYLNMEPQPAYNAFMVGDAVHKGILEPHKFNSQVTFWRQDMLPKPEKTLRTKENSVWLAKEKAQHPDKVMLSEKDYKEVNAMVSSVLSKPRCLELLEGANYELMALKSVEGIYMKSKGDIVRHDKTLVDIKTTKSININDFRESCENYGYWRQAALYAHMFNCDNFSFMCVEKTAPYPVAIYHVPKEKMEAGWNDLVRLIGLYKQYFLGDTSSKLINEHVVEETL